MTTDRNPFVSPRVSDGRDADVADAIRPQARLKPRLIVAAVVAAAGAVAGHLHAARAEEDGPPARAPEVGDAIGRLDRLVEKLDRLVDRLGGERMGPPAPPPPPHHGPGPDAPDGRAELWEPRPHGEPGGLDARGRAAGPGRRPDVGPRPGPRPEPRPEPRPGHVPDLHGDYRPGRPDPWGGMPMEMREMMQRRMEETQRRMREAQEQFRDLQERVRKLEAEVERLRSA